MVSQAPDVGAASEENRRLRGSAWLLLGRVFAVAVGLGSQIVLIRTLSKSDYGVFALGLALAIGVRIVVTLGHNRGIARFLSINLARGRGSRVLGALVLEAGLFASLSAVVGAVTAVIALLVLDDEQRTFYLPVLVLLLIAPLEAWEELCENLFATVGWVGAIVIRQHVIIPLLRLGVVVSVAVGTGSAMWAAVGWVATSICSLLFYLAMLVRLLRTNSVLAQARTLPREYPAREIFGYSLPLLSGELVYLVNGTLNVLLLGSMRGAASVGGLRAVMPLADTNLLVRRQFLRLFVPLAAVLHDRGQRASLGEAYWRTAGWVAVLTFPFVAMTVVFAEVVVRTLFGSAYDSSAVFLRVFAGAYYLNAAWGFNAELLVAVSRLRFLTAVNLASAAIGLGGALLLVPVMGTLGAALATAASLVSQNLLNQWGVRPSLGHALPPRRFWRVYGAIMIGLVVLAVLQVLLSPPLWGAALLTGSVSIALVVATSPALRPLETFPELRRLRRAAGTTG